MGHLLLSSCVCLCGAVSIASPAEGILSVLQQFLAIYDWIMQEITASGAQQSREGQRMCAPHVIR
jgi:hypothetical protein